VTGTAERAARMGETKCRSEDLGVRSLAETAQNGPTATVWSTKLNQMLFRHPVPSLKETERQSMVNAI
jgi:hypothetical protein